LRALANRLRIGEPISAADRALESRWQLLVELAGVLGLQSGAPGAGATTTAARPDAAAADASSGDGPGSPAMGGDAAIEALVEQRRQAKASRDFALADRIRADLNQQGIELVDKPGGVTVWLRR
jgi:cysteinyl-tRNA synthetase